MTTTPDEPLAPWDRREASSYFTVLASAHRVGCYAWVEQRLFELLGGWVASVPELALKRRLAEQAAQHGWHAELWREVLPTLAGLAPDEVVRPANDGLVACFDALAEPQTTGERITGVYRVLLPHLVAAQTFHQRRAATLTDGPVLRRLELVLADEVAQWHDGEIWVQSLLGSPVDVERATAHQQRVESMLVAAGGICGSATLG